MALHTARLAILVALALALVVPIVGCGGGERDARAAAALRADITKGLTGDDVCRTSTYATKRFLAQLSYSVPELAALFARECRRSPVEYRAESVRVSHVNVDGDRATATVTPGDGGYAYGALGVRLVHDGTWKLDALTALDVDRASFSRLMFGSGDFASGTRTERACTTRRLARVSDVELERAVVRSDAGPMVDPIVVCLLRPMLRDARLPLPFVSCMTKALRDDARSTIRILLDVDKRALGRLVWAIGESCIDTHLTA